MAGIVSVARVVVVVENADEAVGILISVLNVTAAET